MARSSVHYLSDFTTSPSSSLISYVLPPAGWKEVRQSGDSIQLVSNDIIGGNSGRGDQSKRRTRWLIDGNIQSLATSLRQSINQLFPVDSGMLK
jgi:hypothetical protein